MGYMIAALALAIIVLFIVCACMVGGRHDRYYFEKNVPVDNHGESPYSAAVPKDVERAMNTKALLAGYGYFFWNDPYGFGGERIFKDDHEITLCRESAASLIDRNIVAFVQDYPYTYSDGKKITFHSLCWMHAETVEEIMSKFNDLQDAEEPVFCGVVLCTRLAAMNEYIACFGEEMFEDDPHGYEDWYFRKYMRPALTGFISYWNAEMNHEEE